jgi:nitrite reductase (NO-forming)
MHSLPLAEVREPPPRTRRHRAYAGVVGCYLLAALVVAAVGDAAGSRRWLSLHLIGLGAATNAVFVWSRHFAQALLHARLVSERATHVRLVVLNAAVVAVLVGVTAGIAWLAATGGVLVVAMVGWHVAALLAMARGHRLPGPLRRVAGFYIAAGIALAVGAGFGAALGGGWVADDTAMHERLHLAHAQLNGFGWIGMAVVGSLFVLWPAVLRTRMPAVVPRLVPWTLLLTALGLALLVTGILTGWTPVAVAGGAGYAAGVVLAVVPMVLALPGQPSRTSSAWWLGAAVGWLLAAVVVDVVRIATVDGPDEILHPVVPMLGAGLFAQALVGALTFLLPVTVGGGPVGNRWMLAVLQRGWPGRLMLVNVGLLLAVVPAPAVLHTVGWVMTLTGLGLFLPLLAYALTGRTPIRD